MTSSTSSTCRKYKLERLHKNLAKQISFLMTLAFFLHKMLLSEILVHMLIDYTSEGMNLQNFITYIGSCFLCDNYNYYNNSRLLYVNSRNGNFCKGTSVSKIIAGAKVNARAVPSKKSTGFPCMSVTATCCILGALLRDNMLMGAFCLCIVTNIIDFLTRAHTKLSTTLLCLCFTLEKAAVFSVFFISYFASSHTPQPIRQPSMQKTHTNYYTSNDLNNI